MQTMRVLFLGVLVSAVSAGCGSAGYANLPIASAMLVHVCAAKETQVKLFGAAPSAISVYEIKLGANSKRSGTIGGGYNGTASVEASLERGASKEVAIHISASVIDAMQLSDCYQRGYISQLGPNGCLLEYNKKQKKDVCVAPHMPLVAPVAPPVARVGVTAPQP